MIPVSQRYYSSTCNKPWLIPGCIQHHHYLTNNAVVIGDKREIFQCNEMREFLLKIDNGWWTTVQLITYAYTQTSASGLGYNHCLAEGIGTLTFHKLIQVKNNE